MRVWIADTDDVAESVLLVVPRSVQVLRGLLEDEWVPRIDTEDVEVELALRVPCVVREDVEDDDVLLDAPIVREVVDDAVELLDRRDVVVVVPELRGVRVDD